MSSQTRTGGGGGGGRNQQASKKNAIAVGDTNGGGTVQSTGGKKTDHSKTDKDNKIHTKQPTAEQIRIAQITDVNSGTDDPKMREKVNNLMEMTQRSEEEVCCALYECDNDLERAVIFLLETLPVGAFETSSKKKKKPVAITGNETGDGDWDGTGTGGNEVRERSRNRGGMRGGRGGSDSRGWRGRESRENERNTNNAGAGGDKSDTFRASRGRGTGRGGFGGGGRGGRGGRMGPRNNSTRDQNRGGYFRPNDNGVVDVDTWDMAAVEKIDRPKADDTWGDWDNEEYTGSLSDTKVFTASSVQTTGGNAPPGLEQQVLNPPSQMADELVQQYSTTVASGSVTASVADAVNPVQFPELHQSKGSMASQHLRQTIDMAPMNSSSSLSAEQSQYFNSLSSQNSNQQPAVNSYQNSVQYSTSFTTTYGDQGQSTQPSIRKQQRARVPPPSKIPSSAVEMPDDTLNNMGYNLDLQFGQLEFGSEDFGALRDKLKKTMTLDNTQNIPQTDSTNDYKTKSTVQQQNSLATASLQASQMISNAELSAAAAQNDSLTSAYGQRSATNVQQSVSSVGNAMRNSVNVPNAYQSGYSNNTSGNKQGPYPSSGGNQGYGNSAYSNNQSGSANSYPSSSTYNTYNPNAVNSYQPNSNSTNSSGIGGTNSVQNIQVGSNSAGTSASSNTNSGYLANQYQSSQTGGYQGSQQSGYQTSQSVYGNSALANNTGASASSVSSSTSNVGITGSGTNISASTTSSISSPALGLTNTTKVTSSTGVKSGNTTAGTGNAINTNSSGTNNSTGNSGSGGVMPNISMVSQYIQTGMPFYQQPVYSYEDIQMMQQRMPHVPAGYYDLNYQTPTSLGAAGVRDGNIGTVAYSTVSDGRFTRTDNNSSPSNVPSTMSQQTGSGGPMLNVPYYFYGGNMMPGGFPYGTPAIYPQTVATQNISSGGQFPKPSYNSGYGSTGYDALNQSAQDYNKSGYPGVGQINSGVGQQSKGQNVSNQQLTGTGTDLNSSMYGKSHAALNKVNSYEKQSYNSGTPPPGTFNLPGTQNVGATTAQAYGAQHLFIQALPATHHNMNLHQPIHQDSSSAGQRQQSNNQGKSAAKQGYSPSSYWTAQN